MYLVGAGSLGALLGVFVTSAVMEYQGIGSLIGLFGVYACLLVSAYSVLMAITRDRPD